MLNAIRLPLTVVCLTLLNQVPTLAAEPKGKETLSQLSLEVSALQTIHRFQMTPEQLGAIKRLAAETAPKNDARQDGKGNDKVRKVLVDLREALVQGDDDKIVELEEALGDMLESDDVDFDDHVKITPGARKKAAELLHGMKPRQVAEFYAAVLDELPDPNERLIQVIDFAGKLKDEEWKEVVEDLVEEMGWQLGGSDAERSRFVKEKVEQFLKKVRGLNAKDLTQQRPELEKSIRQFTSQIPATVVLHNFAEHHLADMLSNPMLTTAVEIYQKK